MHEAIEKRKSNSGKQKKKKMRSNDVHLIKESPQEIRSKLGQDGNVTAAASDAWSGIHGED